MAVTVVVPRVLAPYAGGRTTLDVGNCRTVADTLAAVAAQHPALGDRVMTEQGVVRPHINVFVGEDNVRFAEGVATAVPDGATVMIVAAVSGG